MNDKEINQDKKTAEEKSLAIINSCTTCEHFINALSFLDLYFKQFNDKETYDDLISFLRDKKIELNCYD